jgi:medium-chain acyl-[acyl-carrier-protein] hydrolase
LRADFEIFETYVHAEEPPLACPITAFGGTQDPLTTEKGLEAWFRHTTRRFERVLLPGDHFFLRTSEPALLEHLRSRLSALAGYAS